MPFETIQLTEVALCIQILEIYVVVKWAFCYETSRVLGIKNNLAWIECIREWGLVFVHYSFTFLFTMFVQVLSTPLSRWSWKSHKTTNTYPWRYSTMTCLLRVSTQLLLTSNSSLIVSTQPLLMSNSWPSMTLFMWRLLMFTVCYSTNLCWTTGKKRITFKDLDNYYGNVQLKWRHVLYTLVSNRIFSGKG